MENGVPELKENESIDMEYEGNVRVIKQERPELEYNYFLFQAPKHKHKSYDLGPEWESHTQRGCTPMSTRSHGLVRRRQDDCGIPKNAEQHGREAVIAYQRNRPGVDVDWLANYYDIDR